MVARGMIRGGSIKAIKTIKTISMVVRDGVIYCPGGFAFIRDQTVRR
ncbi:hypothetical protein [Sphingomonas sp. SRS2]|nr:hypothetical protein [Sphingomonas sp. SRS2]